MTLRCICLLVPVLAFGQAPCQTKHLSIFDAGLGEFTEERMVNLQPGANTVEWRGLVPQAVIGTLRVVADQADVVRQSVTADLKAPAVHLVLNNGAPSGPHKVRLDYLAPKLSWKADYSLVLGPAAILDGWISVKNETGTDICADAADLIAGDVHLIDGENIAARDFVAQAATLKDTSTGQGAEISSLSVFSRIALGHDIFLAANSWMERFPLVQGLRLGVEQRNVFENDAGIQTLGRSGFTLVPRGLEVRLVSRNSSSSPLPAGTVTIYSQDNVVGQDRIPLTPAGADLTISQGRSNTLQGSRRIVSRVQEPDRDNRFKLLTRVEVIIDNHGADPAPVFVREGVENFGKGDWTVTQSSHPEKRLGERSMEFKLDAPARGRVKLEYTVETR